MGANRVYNDNEERYIEDNYKLFEQFINEFYLSIGCNLENLLPAEIDKNDPSAVFYGLKYMVNSWLGKYKDEFYRVLASTGYDMKSELIDAMKLLAKIKDLTFYYDLISHVKQSPYIDAVELNGSEVIIKSERLGDQKFTSVKNYFQNNQDVLRLFQMGGLDHKCHQFSMELAHDLDEDKIITSLLPLYFKGTYYHSYLIDKEDNIIDGVNYSVMKKDDYDKLFRPSEIIRYDYEEMYGEYLDAIRDGFIDERDMFQIPVAVALSKQLRGK